MGFRKEFFNRKHKEYSWLRDSKLLLAKQREKYASKLMADKDIQFQLAYVYPKTVDKLNVYNAARLAMKRVIKKLASSLSVKSSVFDTSQRSVVLVDGKTKIKGLNMEQIPIIKGDCKVFAIACASIIAKVHRDKMMERYAKKYPGYGFEKHKGYGTKLHREKLAAFGVSDIHRCSFAPVKVLIQNAKIKNQNDNVKLANF